MIIGGKFKINPVTSVGPVTYNTRVKRLISSTGDAGISFPVLRNRLKLADDVLAPVVENLVNDGVVEVRETGRVYRGEPVFHFYIAKEKPKTVVENSWLTGGF